MAADQPSIARVTILRLLSLLLVPALLSACGGDEPGEPEVPEVAEASAAPRSAPSAGPDTVVLPAARENRTVELTLAAEVMRTEFVLIDTVSGRGRKACEVDGLSPTVLVARVNGAEQRLGNTLAFTHDLPLGLDSIPPEGGQVSISCPGERRLVLAIQRTTSATAQSPATITASVPADTAPANNGPAAEDPKKSIDWKVIGIAVLFLAGVFALVSWMVKKPKNTKNGERQPQSYARVPRARNAWFPQNFLRRNNTTDQDEVKILLEKISEVKQLLDQRLPPLEREGRSLTDGFSEEDRQSLTKICEWMEEARAAGGTTVPRVENVHAEVVTTHAGGGQTSSETAGVDEATGQAPVLGPDPVVPASAEPQNENSELSNGADVLAPDEWKLAADSATAGETVASLLPESVFQQIVELGSDQSKHRLDARYAEFRRRLSAMKTTIDLIVKDGQAEKPGQQPDSEIVQAAARLKSVDAWLALQETGLRAGFFPMVTYLQTNHANPQSVRDRIGTDLQVSLELLRGDDTVFSRRLDEVLEKLRPALIRINRRRSDIDPSPTWLEKLKEAIYLTPFDLSRGDLDIRSADPGDDQGGGAIAKVLAPGYHYQGKVLLRARVQRSESGGLSGVGSGAE
jgi:hypothetical protein